MPDLGNIVMAALGISFLIFIHEMGHFLAGRFFDVRIETFSIGFGPRLLAFTRGETEYRIALIPLGGYVKFSGEYADCLDDAPLDPRDLTAKPAWQRAIVFSGGVAANFAFAFIIFPVVFALGVPFQAPVVGTVIPGAAAWQSGVQAGDEVLTVNGNRVYSFSDVALEVALSDSQATTFSILRDNEEIDVTLRPHLNTAMGRLEAGIHPSDDGTLLVEPDGPAAMAGLKTGDALVSINGIAVQPKGRATAALEDSGIFGFSGGQPANLVVERDGILIESKVIPSLVSSPEIRRLGIFPIETKVGARRGAADSDSYPLQVNDVVLAVKGAPVTTSSALLEAITESQSSPTIVTISRAGEEMPVTLSETQQQELISGEVVFVLNGSGRQVQVIPGGAADQAGIQDGDEIISINGTLTRDYQHLASIIVESPLDEHEIHYRRGTIATVTVRTAPIDLFDYGFGLHILEVVHKESLPGALAAGFDLSTNALRTTALTLSKLVTGDVHSKNLGGIVSISVLSCKS